MKTAIQAITCILLILLTALSLAADDRQRLIVLTDISNEPDDEESLVRLLVYANEFQIEGLIATTSVWLRDRVRRDLIRERIDAYGRVRENLLVHAQGFPTTDHLLSITRAGVPRFGMAGVGEGRDSEGSRLIVEVVDRPDPRPVWVAVWGGANCLAQALWSVQNSREEEELERFVSKLRVYTISDQDDSGAWMRKTFPDLFYIVSPSTVDYREYHRATWTGISGDRQYKNGPMSYFEMVDNPWLEENVIRDHGPLGALYPKLQYIMEGDTPSFLGLIRNGLGSHISPSYGGWGGRYVLYQNYGETRAIWTNNSESRDTVVAEDGKTYTSDQATIWRWREAYQNDFAARMDWCVAGSFDEANHNPRPVVQGDRTGEVLEYPLQSGESLLLDGDGSEDPDGDRLRYRWFQYQEAGSYPRAVEIENSRSSRCRVNIPQESASGTAHIVFEVQDTGSPTLTAYRRIILRIEGRD